MKYLRDNGVFSVGGNDSPAFAENYASIFGHSDPLPVKKLPKAKRVIVGPKSPVVRMHRLHD